jgi:hypothetical protein
MQWLDPPGSQDARTGPTPKHVNEVRELKRNPKRWAVLQVANDAAHATSLRSKSYAIQQGRLQAFRPEDEFETCVRKLKDGKFALFVRYIGEVQ